MVDPVEYPGDEWLTLEDPTGTYEDVKYKEESISWEWTNGEFRGRREFITQWVDSLRFVRIITRMPFPNIDPGGGEEAPDFDYTKPRTIQVEGFGTIGQNEEPGKTGEWTFARIVCIFIPFSYSPWEGAAGAQTLVIEQGDIAAEFLQMPEGHYVWKDEPSVQIEERIGQVIPSEEFQIVEPLVPGFDTVQDPPGNTPREAIKLGIGKVNSKTFGPFAPGTVLYLGIAYRRMSGLVADTGPHYLVHKFRQREIPWNQAFRPGHGWRDVVGGPEPQDPPYLEYDLELVIITQKLALP